MPDLGFQITGVEPAAHGLTPLLHFKLAVSNTPETETIHSIILQAQIQIQSPQRSYNPREKGKLLDLFGPPERWGQTLRNKLWAHAHATVRQFAGSTETILPVPCTFDLNVMATKYFYALEAGDVSLLFLFSGTIFYAAPPDGRLQVQQISWNQECVYRMPARTWQELMEQHYPKSAFLPLPRDVFDRLYDYKCRHGIPTLEGAVERLLAAEGGVPPTSLHAPPWPEEVRGSTAVARSFGGGMTPDSPP